MNKSYVENLISDFKLNSTVKITKVLRLEDLLYKDENNITLLEYMLMNNYDYHYSLVNGLKENIEALKLICKYNKESSIFGINTSTFLLKVDENQTLLEYLIDTNKINNISISALKYDLNLVNILMKKERFDLLGKIKFNEGELFFSDNKIIIELLESNALEYVNLPVFVYHEEIVDILLQYGKGKLLESISFDENLLLKGKNNSILKRILDLGYYPNIEHCSFKVLEYLYKINRADALIRYFDNIDNILDLFKNIDNNKKLTVIDYLLEFDKKEFPLNFKELGLNVYDQLDEIDQVDIYLKFSIYKKLDYLDRLSKEEFLKKNKKSHCLLDTFVLRNLDETFKVLSYYGLDKDIDIVMYFKLNGIDMNTSNVDLSMLDDDYSKEPIVSQGQHIKESVDIEYLGEENVYLLAKLEEVLSENSDKELVEAITLLYSKELAKGNNDVLIEINKLIEIKKSHPEFIITKSDSSYFNHKTGLHLASGEVNILSHELGHVFHYYLADDRTPFGFDTLIEQLKNDSKLLSKVDIFSRNMITLEDSIYKKLDKEYNEWAEHYYSDEKLDILREYIESDKENKIKYYMNLGYAREELELILNESYTLEQYMKCHKRIEKNERVNNVMSVSYSEVQAISDIIDAIYGGEYYNSRLKLPNGKTIKGTFGHGMVYYHSIDVVFQEIFANYCLLLKSDRSRESLDILRDIVGNELIILLDKYYNEELLNSPKYEKGIMIL